MKIRYLVEGLVVLLFFGAVAFACHLSYSTKEINEELKKELKETKEELEKCKGYKQASEEAYNDLFKGYIDLGIKCGANE